MSMKRKNAWLYCAFAALSILATTGAYNCSNSQGSSDASYDGSMGKDVSGGDTESGDTSPSDTTVILVGCTNRDNECPPDKICNVSIGKCEDGKKCPQGIQNCAYQQEPDNPDYCGTDGLLCYCDAEGQTCKRRALVCEPCGNDKECGENADEENAEDRCIDYPEGKRCGKMCGSLGRKCPRGFECVLVPGNDKAPYQCRPARANSADPFTCNGSYTCETTNDCADPNHPTCEIYLSGSKVGVCSKYCTSDTFCGIDNLGYVQICNAETGVCTSGCADKNGVPYDDKCPSGKKTCHYNGRCNVSCTGDKDCETWFGKEVGWVCKPDKTGSKSRCQFCLEKNLDGTCAQEGCSSDLDCTNRPTYCDRNTHVCQDGKCRTFEDCVGAGYDCTNGECIKQNCIQEGGAKQGCHGGEFCCGENKAIECKDPEGNTVAEGVCFKFSSPPFCTKCEGKEGECPKEQGYDGRCWEIPDNDGGTKAKYCGNPCTENGKGECPRNLNCSKQQDENGNPVFMCSPFLCEKYMANDGGMDGGSSHD